MAIIRVLIKIVTLPCVRVFFALSSLLLSGLGAADTLPQKARGAAACSEPDSSWCSTYQKRKSDLDLYLAQNRDDFRSFAAASLGHAGFPYMLLRLAPELFPDLIEAQGKDFARLGFGPNRFEPTLGLPLGLNYAAQTLKIGGKEVGTPLQVATLSCGGCHIGRVNGPDGRVIELVGAGNSHFDSSGLFQLFRSIVLHPNYRPERVRAAILAKPAGWFYGSAPDKLLREFLEKEIYLTLTSKVLDGIKQNTLAGHERQDKFINQTAYIPNGAASYFDRTPGRADAVGLTLSLFLTDDQVSMMPQRPTITKIMSVWAQKDRTLSHWTGDMPSGVHPVVAASVAVVGDGKSLNQDNIVRSTRFLERLPPPPYPFAVDSARAARGEKLYARYCASCHRGDARVYEDVGTDPARLGATTPVTYKGFDRALHEGCPKAKMPGTCYPDAQPILRPRASRLGYLATPLDGIWARAPYLHNGSVPTLYHLLVPRERPLRFVVGSMEYDSVNVGFEWQEPMDNSEIYETGRPAQMANGHDTPAYLGPIDWEHEDALRDDLIEYMKTL